MDSEIVAALVGPVITAALAASAVGIREWRARRESQDRRSDALDQAIKEVAFIDAWLTAQSKLADPSQVDRASNTARARSDLDRAYQVMNAVRAEELTVAKRRSTVDRLRSLLLLNLARTPAKVVRVFYLICAAAGLLFVFAGVASGFDTQVQGVALNVLVAMFFTLFSFAPAIVLFWVARLLDRPPRTATATAPVPPSGAPPPWGYGPPVNPSYANPPPPGPGYPTPR